jgi:UPF0716 protein FxsA
MYCREGAVSIGGPSAWERGMWIFVALLGAPIAEIAGFILVGGWIGLWPTLGLVALGGVAGALLLRGGGVRALLEAQRLAERGEDPSLPTLEAALAIAGAILLMLPGFLSDIAGLCLLVPPLRARAAAWLAPRMSAVVIVGGVRARARPGREAARGPVGGPDDAPIEVEYREVDPDAPAPGSPPR